MNSYELLLRIVLSIVASLLVPGCSRSANDPVAGGSETVGIYGQLVDNNNTPVDQAIVKLYSPGADTNAPPIAIDTSTIHGEYSFDTSKVALDPGEYFINALTRDSLLAALIKGVDFMGDSLFVGVDTMKTPGTIAGTVITSGPFHAGVLAYVPGTSFLAVTGNDGRFAITSVPEGLYSVYYLRVDYLPDSSTQVSVVPGDTTTTDTIKLVRDPSGAPPTPAIASVTFDSAGHTVTITWNRVEVSDLKGYKVYLDTGSTQPLALNSSPVIDTFFIDTVIAYVGDSATVRTYLVSAIDAGFNESPLSAPDSVLTIPPDSTAPSNTWSSATSMGQARRSLALVECGGKAYALGGEGEFLASNFEKAVLTTVEEYDRELDRWTTRTAMPVGRYQFAAASVNGSIYVFGGGGQSRDPIRIDRYTPSTDTWDSVGVLPQARQGLAAAAIGNKIYLVGGLTQQDQTTATSDAILEFDPATGNTTAKANLAVPRYLHQVVAIDSALVVMGGHGGSSNPYQCTTQHSVERYDPITNSVSALASMGAERLSFGAVATEDRIFAFGGFVGDGAFEVLKSVEYFDLTTATWQWVTDMPRGHHKLAACPIGKSILLAGGTPRDYTTMPLEQTNEVRIYNP